MPVAARSLWLLFVVLAAPAAADCPPSPVGCNLDASETQDAIYSTSCDGPTTLDVSIPAGTFAGSAWLPTVAINRRAVFALRDQFTVTGLPAGTPIALKLRLHVTMESFAGGGPGDFAGFFLKPRAFPQLVGETYPEKGWGSNESSVVATDSLDMVLQRTAGTPIGMEIVFDLVAQAFCYARAQASFEFVNLPPGVTVTSCHGYLQEPPVPARLASWGRVKAAYR